VGYAGGTQPHPTYHTLGDHTETIEIDFDPGVISYEKLLDIFWRSHHPGQPAWSRQYRAVIFYHGERQKALALKTRDQVAALTQLLAGLPQAARARLPGIEPAKAGVMVAGALIVLTILTVCRQDSLLVIDAGLLEGVLHEMALKF